MKNKSMKKVLLVMALMVLFVIGGCRQSNKVAYNVSQDADNFNVVRRVVVTNVRTDKVMFEVIGNISIDASSDDQLEIIVEVRDGVYKKHIVNMTEWNMYVVEDLDGVEVNQFKYEVNYMPESIIPVEIVNKK